MGIVAVALFFVAQPAWAARLRVHEMADSQQYGQKAGGMLGRGLLNAATCFVDPIVNIVNETKAGPPLVGTLTGVAKGLSCGVLRLGSGALDVVTFWVPGFNGFPVSDSYENCLAMSGSSAAQMSEPAAAPIYSPRPSTQDAMDVPTTEPGAAQAPATTPPAPHKTSKRWKK